MPELVPSTFRILKEMAFDADRSVDWKDWAIEMIDAGFESESLYLLAAITTPYNPFQLRELTNRALDDLNISYKHAHLLVRNYIHFLVVNALNKPETYFEVLREITVIWSTIDFKEDFLGDLYLLYYMKEDIMNGELYYDGLTKDNINQVITDRFNDWLGKNELVVYNQ